QFKPPAKLVNYGHAVNETTTDAAGRFKVQSMIGMESLLIVHESGCAALAALAKTNLVVPLTAWGAVEGILYLGGAPAAGQSIDIGFQSTSYALDIPRLPFDLTEKTDQAGHFRFARVPAGAHTVYQLIDRHPDGEGEIGFSHGESVTVRPGETSQVTLGGKGQPVIGRFVLVPPLTNYNWKQKLVALVESRPDLAPPRETQALPSPTFFRQWNLYNAAIAKYYLEFGSDGSFRAEDVLPGRYTLAFTVTAEPAQPMR